MATIDIKTGVITKEDANETSYRQYVATGRVTVSRNGLTDSATADAYQAAAPTKNLIIVTDGTAVDWNSYVEIAGSGSYDRSFTKNVTRYEYEGVTSFKTSNRSSTSDSGNVSSHIKEIYVSGTYDSLVLLGIAPDVLDVSGLDTSQMTTFAYMFCGVTFPDTDVNLSHFNMGKVTSTAYMFYGSNITSFTGLGGMKYVTDMQRMFCSCSDLVSLDTTGWDTSAVTNMAYTFRSCSSATAATFATLADWDVSSVTTMQATFSGCSSLESLDFLSSWKTTSLTSLYQTFHDCSSLTDVDGLGNWDTSKVTTLYGTFYGCSSLTDTSALAGWDTSKVTTLYQTFRDCSSLEKPDGLYSWDVSKVTTLYETFRGCSSLNDLNDISGWDVSSVTTMQATFYGCSSLTTVMDLYDWDVSKVTTLYETFYGCSSLTNADGLSDWKTTSLTSLYGTFYGCSSLSDIDGLKGWDTSNVTTLNYTFDTCYALTSDACKALAGWDTSKVTTMSMTFFACRQLTDLNFLSGWSQASLRNMSGMFHNCNGLTDISGIAGWDTSRVTTMSNLFHGDYGLTDDAMAVISGWTVTSVTDISAMLQDCSLLTNLDFLSTWTFGTLVDISGFVQGCSSLTDISPMAGWDVSAVTTMAGLFRSCTSLPSISDIAGWKPTKVAEFGDMLYNCTALDSVTPVTDWTTNTAAVTDIDGMFYGLKFAEYDLSNLDISAVDTPRHVFGGDGNLTHVKFKELGTKAKYTSSLTDTYGFLYGCSALTSLDGDIGTIGAGYKGSSLTYRGDVDLSGAPLDHDTAMKFINALEEAGSADYNTLYLHADTYAALTADEIAVGTAKKWGVQVG